MKELTQDSKLCNCRHKKQHCPLDGKCLTKCVVYKATVTETTSNNQETYIGPTGNEFKTRFNLHKSSFKLEHKRTSTSLSDHISKLKKTTKKKTTSTSTSNGRSSKKWSYSLRVIKCANFAYRKISPSLGLHYLEITQQENFGHYMHKKRFLLSHNNIQMSTGEVL